MPVDFVFSAVVLCSVVLHCIGLIMSGSVVMMIASFFPNRGGLCLPLVVILGYYRSALCLAYYYFDWVDKRDYAHFFVSFLLKVNLFPSSYHKLVHIMQISYKGKSIFLG